MNILITGASRGIGFEIVKYFAGKDHMNVFALSRNKAALDRLVSVCAGLNKTSVVTPLTIDLLDVINDASLLTKKLPGDLHLEVLINNAGYLENKSFTQINRDDLVSTFNINFFAPALLIRQLLQCMGGKSVSHVVNIASMGGYQGSQKYPGLSLYSSSKAALACLTECLNEEMKDRNIVFNCLALGSVQTEMLSEAFPGYKAPLKASEMAEFIGNFALTAHRFIQGKILPVSITNP